MENISDLLGNIGGWIGVCAYVPYIVSILLSKTKPSRLGWGMWVCASTMLYVTYQETNPENVFHQTKAYMIGTWIVFFISLFFGVKKDKNDTKSTVRIQVICIIISLISGGVWFLIKKKVIDIPSPDNIILTANLIIDMVGTAIVYFKIKNYPASEGTLGWWLFFTASTFTLLSGLLVPGIPYKVWAYPAVMLLGSLIILMLVYSQRKLKLYK